MNWSEDVWMTMFVYVIFGDWDEMWIIYVWFGDKVIMWILVIFSVDDLRINMFFDWISMHVMIVFEEMNMLLE